MFRKAIFLASVTSLLFGCSSTGGTNGNLQIILRDACAIYENPIVVLGTDLYPQAAVVKAALDPWVMKVCSNVAQVTDPTTPQWVMMQFERVKVAQEAAAHAVQRWTP